MNDERPAPRRHRRPKHALIACAFLGVLASSLAAFGAQTPARAGERPTAVVHMGDSYASGEGGRWAGNTSEPDEPGNHDFRGTDLAKYRDASGKWRTDKNRVYTADSIDNRCHRSDRSAIASTPAIDVDARINLACSGANAKNVWRSSHGGESTRGEAPQADRLAALAKTHDIKAIYLGIGGNDAGFAKIAYICIRGYLTTPPGLENRCRANIRKEFEPRFEEVRKQVVKSLKEIRAVMSEAGKSPSEYRLYLTGYPNVFPDARNVAYKEHGPGRAYTGHCPLWDEDFDYMEKGFVPRLNASMRLAAHQVQDVAFLDTRDTFDGHGVCDKRTVRGVTGEPAKHPEKAEWGRFLDYDHRFLDLLTIHGQGDGGQESLHPNAYGQQALGNCLEKAYRRSYATVKCSGGPGLAPTAMTMRADATPQFHHPGAAPIPGSSEDRPYSTSVKVPSGLDTPGGLGLLEVELDHPRNTDLSIELRTPSGKVHTLARAGTLSVHTKVKRFTVPLEKEEAGTYTLKVRDHTGGRNGTVTKWSLAAF
ncbi:proprotein convertase P-domain-containing protein [Streptomyces sp. NPDC048639]|uniref:proprotein convertase P-domain-containing protein n=1 Tax=Streptomyces sp. NPDC048639 TaxID=3365581 RepID=UPI003710C84D